MLQRFRGGVVAMTMANHKNGLAIVERAKTLRQTGSVVERVLWKALRSDPQQKELKFRFQYPLSYYVADFICLSAKLVIEIDGLSHDATERKDAQRQEYIEAQGYHVLRFSNQDVLRDVGAVAEQIRLMAQERWNVLRAQTPPRSCKATSTLPQGEGGGSCD